MVIDKQVESGAEPVIPADPQTAALRLLVCGPLNSVVSPSRSVTLISGLMKSNDKAIPVLALIVSMSTAFFSHVQSRTSAAQLGLTEQQLRPHVSHVPTFFRTKSALSIDIYLQNQSPLPANVLYADVAAWIGNDFLSPNFRSMSPDIVHQDKGGLSSLPPIEGKPLSRIDQGDALTLATCVIYTSTSRSDSRRWRLQAIHEYIPGSSLPKRLLIREEEAASSELECSAKGVRALLVSAMATSSSKAAAPSKWSDVLNRCLSRHIGIKAKVRTKPLSLRLGEVAVTRALAIL